LSNGGFGYLPENNNSVQSSIAKVKLLQKILPTTYRKNDM